MSESDNNHITEYLDYYFSLEVPPEYAVLLRGRWGSGKSWFVKNHIEKDKKNEYLYVSLYGVTSYKEIENSFFQQIHPVLASKGMKLAGKILKGLLKTTIKVDLDKDKTENLNISSTVPDINIPDYLKNIDNKKLVFDDLERCSIPIENILGYINQFVENNGLKVIVIANEEEIIKTREPDSTALKGNSYLSIKEKIIGKSFDIQTDINSAIKDFIRIVKIKELKELFEEKVYLLKELFNASGYNNLRHLRQTILDFERFYVFLPKSAFTKPQLIDHIISLFFSLSFELKKGTMIETELDQLFQIDYLMKKKGDRKTDTENIREKYSILKLYHHPVHDGIWKSYFKNGTIDREELKLSIESSNYFRSENTPNWIKLWYYSELDDTDFNSLFKLVYKQFKEKKIENKYELLQIVGVFFSLMMENLIRHKKNDIIDIAKLNILAIKEKGKLKNIKDEEFPGYSSHGLGYQCVATNEIKELINYIQDQISRSQFDDYPKLAEELLNILSESIEKFKDKIILSNSHENLYYEVPILKFISPEDFVQVILKLPNREKKYLGDILEKRYQIAQFNSKLKDELPWLRELVSILNVEKAKLQGKISGNIIIPVLLQSLNKSINILELST